ncbi:hypothetical protein D3C81_1483070 [compost metagenome]
MPTEDSGDEAFCIRGFRLQCGDSIRSAGRVRPVHRTLLLVCAQNLAVELGVCQVVRIGAGHARGCGVCQCRGLSVGLRESLIPGPGHDPAVSLEILLNLAGERIDRSARSGNGLANGVLIRLSCRGQRRAYVRRRATTVHSIHVLLRDPAKGGLHGSQSRLVRRLHRAE